MFGSILYEERKGKGKEGKIEQVLLPPKLGEFGGEGKCVVYIYITFFNLSLLLF
jgi:hypothetical protein